MINKVVLSLCFSSFIVFSANADALRKIESIRVIDGDTVEVTYKASVRLNDIDCFETTENSRGEWQQGEYNKTKEEVLTEGKASKEKLREFVEKNKDNLYLQVKGLDKYKRLLGKIFIGKDKKESINDYMLNEGGCMPYKSRKKK